MVVAAASDPQTFVVLMNALKSSGKNQVGSSTKSAPQSISMCACPCSVWQRELLGYVAESCIYLCNILNTPQIANYLL